LTEEKRKELSENAEQIAKAIIDRKTSTEYTFELKGIILDSLKYYEEIKNKVKSFISTEEFNQDRHKIAATIVISILNYNPIEVKTYPAEIQKAEAEIWINQIFAIMLAEYIVFRFLGKSEIQNFILPTNTTSGKSYIDYLLALIHSIKDNITHRESDIKKLSNYVTSLSNIFYLLEQYTLDIKNSRN
jgi:hypothetical protein